MNRNRVVAFFLAAGMVAFSSAADTVREEELEVSSYVQLSNVAQPVDLRAVYPVTKAAGELVLTNLAYSAIGWERDAAADATRTVTITAQAGTLADGVFTSDGTAAITVMAAKTGRGTCDWTVTGVSTNVNQVYQFTHTVSQSGSVDTEATLIGYHYFKFGEEEGKDDAQRVCRAQAEAMRRTDFRSSPRQILRREWVLPFQYSATNWTGLTTASAEAKAAVSIVRLKGSDSDPLTSWTEEPNKRRDLLKPTAGEGETRWNTAAGVWKATHYLIDGSTTNATESAIFDVRETQSGTRVTAE